VEHQQDTASLVMTDFQFYIDPMKDGNGRDIASPTKAQRDMSTLCYLCMIKNEDIRSQKVPFTWNWLEQNQMNDCHGVISINRNVLRDYIERTLTNIVKSDCIWVSSWTDHDAFSTSYKATLRSGQEPTLSKPATGKEVLNYTYSSESYDDTSHEGLMNYGNMRLQSTTGVTVEFEGNLITIVQNLKIFMSVRQQYTTVSGDVVRKKLTDKYTIAVNEHGQLKVNLESIPEDTSEDPSAGGFENLFTQVNHVKDEIKNGVTSFVSSQLHDIPIEIANGFIYPGGKVYTFKDVQFSNNQDLVSKITYVDNF